MPINQFFIIYIIIYIYKGLFDKLRNSSCSTIAKIRSSYYGDPVLSEFKEGLLKDAVSDLLEEHKEFIDTSGI